MPGTRALKVWVSLEDCPAVFLRRTQRRTSFLPASELVAPYAPEVVRKCCVPEVVPRAERTGLVPWLQGEAGTRGAFAALRRCRTARRRPVGGVRPFSAGSRGEADALCHLCKRALARPVHESREVPGRPLAFANGLVAIISAAADHF